MLGRIRVARASARACLDILEQERAMAQYIEESWDRFAALSLREEGVPLG